MRGRENMSKTLSGLKKFLAYKPTMCQTELSFSDQSGAIAYQLFQGNKSQKLGRNTYFPFLYIK